MTDQEKTAIHQIDGHGPGWWPLVKSMAPLCIVASVAIIVIASYDLGVGIAGQPRPYAFSFGTIVLLAAMAATLQILGILVWTYGDSND